ncbi:MAG: ChaN family lipoprotein [Steroidobacteraceae bacterium]
MPRPRLLPLIAGTALLALGANLAAAADRLVEKDGRYVLNRPFADFYDTAFVLSDGGRSRPRVVSLERLAAALASYDVVFFGENHRHPGVHLQQMRLLRALHARHPQMILSLEQFERDVQGVLDDYLAGRVGENALTDKGRAWDNYAPSYRPLVTFAKDHGLPVIAAEAPTWAVSCVGQWGPEILQQFTPEERGWVAAELHVTPGPYRDKYMRFQSGTATHGGGGAPSAEAQLKAERSFAGQVVRDDTMAESIFLALRRYPGRKVLHLDGNFHTAAFLGTAERLQLRDPRLRIAVIDPVEIDDPARPSFARERLADGTALQLIYPNPPAFADGEDSSEWVRKVMAKRKANPCKYTPPGAVQPGAAATATAAPAAVPAPPAVPEPPAPAAAAAPGGPSTPPATPAAASPTSAAPLAPAPRR